MRGRERRWEFFVVIKQPPQFFCEIANLSIVLVGQRLSEFALNHLDVFID